MAVKLSRRRLSADQVRRRLKALKGWKVDGVFLSKKYAFPTFLEAVAFMNRVFAAAEEQDHHPDLYNVWAYVTVKWSTHDAGGITAWDFAMAARCDELR
jgi:4a-hydroxytetrahydrobiopterin dehydratase